MEKIFILSLINVALYLVIKTKTSLHMLQQKWYDLDQRYLKWIIKNPHKVFVNPDMLFVLFIAGLFINTEITMIFFAMFYLVLAYNTYKTEAKTKAKLPLKVTSRVKRLAITTFILYLIPILTMALSFDVYNLSTENTKFVYKRHIYGKITANFRNCKKIIEYPKKILNMMEYLLHI